MSEESVNIEEQPCNTNVEESPAVAATPKQTKLPMAKIKNIMKCDPDANIVSNEAVFITAKATEFFIDAIAKETYSITAKGKRKTVTKKDLQTILDTLDCLCFMEGTIDI
ncbi:DNA polymerase epsilon subunit 4-like [Arctopsyche grandis]|uniref:DNA polymerase epsilon subunit 4-like n=1 Tax=Arctopsyche grandis TaxID=121162 RepID=UPI00406D9DE4